MREHHPAWEPSNALAKDSAYDAERIAHLRRSNVPFAAPPGGPLHSASGGDKTQLSQTPLSWLLAVPGSPRFDSFPRYALALFFSMALGVPIPEPPGLDPAPDERLCRCHQPLDKLGHHRLSCPKWYRSTATRSHDRLVHSLVDALRSFGTACTAQPSQIPTHGHSNKHGDIFFEPKLLSGRSVVVDVAVAHPVTGNPRSPNSPAVGKWQPETLSQRFSSKKSKHNSYYLAIGCTFVPLVVSTFGVMHEDFVRFLWLVSRPSQDSSLAVGEVREAGPSASLRQLLFAKLRARVAVAAAYAAAMRLLAVPLDRGTLPPTANYVPDDPTFTHDSALAGLPIGPVSVIGVV